MTNDDKGQKAMVRSEKRRLTHPKACEVIEPSEQQRGFSDAQRTQIIEGSFRVAEDVGTIVKGIVEIHAIRAHSTREIGRIEAETHKVIEQTKADLEKIRAQRESTQTRAEATTLIIRQVQKFLEGVPDLDPGSRRALIDGLPKMISATLGAE
jgi:hypothetical protein